MAREEVSIAGWVAAVTGGARGIGLATAKALQRAGAQVAIGDIDGDLAAKAAEDVGGGAIGLPLDVTDRSSFEGFVASVEERLGPIDLLVNNAGIMHLGRFVEESDEQAQGMIDVNVHGVLHGMKVVIPGMVERGRGHVVNIASTAGKGGFPGGATYCASKHAVVGVSEAVRAELRDTPVELSVVMPGIVNTELATGLVMSRGVTAVEPEDVANEVVSAVRRRRFDVFVPRSVGPINKLMALLPRPGREAVARALKADRVLAEADATQRTEYEARAARRAGEDADTESEKVAAS